MDNLNIQDGSDASLVRSGGVIEGGTVIGHYVAICYDKDGKEKWREEYDNLVTDLGARAMLDGILDNAAKGAVVMGLKGTGSAAVADTQASHAGWLEVGAANAPTYSGTRKTPSWSAAAGSTGAGNRQKATSAAVVFTFTGSGTVAGSFINIGGSATQDNTTGTLFSAGDFSGSKSVVSTDVLNVTYTLNL